jgi:hypothetical protein
VNTLLTTMALGKEKIVREIAICWRQINEIVEGLIRHYGDRKNKTASGFATTDDESARMGASR